ncbi:MAG: S53 family peptidase [Acidimicrobiales bacterium]
MRPSITSGISLLAAGLVLAPLAAIPAQASTPGTAAPHLAATATRAADTGRAVELGGLSSRHSLNLVVTLKAPHPAAEAAALRAMYTPGSSTFHRFLTPAQFTARWAPSRAAVSSATSYLAGHGFSHIRVLSNRMVVTATGTAADAMSAFHTHLASFRVGGLDFFANTSPALVPSALASSVQAVLGLNDIPLPLVQPLPAKTQAGSPDIEGGLTPAQFQTTYDAAGTPSGSATSIALLTEGDLTQVIKDLRQAETVNHLPRVSVTEIPVGPQSSDTSGMDEFDMDTQSSTGMATTVKSLYLYNIGSLADAQVDLDFATFVVQDKAQAMSASIGGCDLGPYLDGSMVSTDAVLQEGALQGQTLFASSGDNGSGCAFVAATGAPSSFPGTNWPASGEFTTAVGGTSLISDSSGNRISEIGWLGSGGGISEVENPGWWTTGSDLGYDAQYVSGGRAVPDVALDADPNVATPALIYVDGQIQYLGGTSLSSPLMLGAWARLQSAHKNQLGLASIDLYAVYDKVNPGSTLLSSPISQVVPAANPSPVAGFTDITLGTNGTYVARRGYDEVTGLGAPDIAALNKVIP